MSHGAMGGGSAECKISMLWNWHTVDACFLTESWRIPNNGAFAATCIGVALLTVCLEAIRRLGREYDAFLLRQFRARVSHLEDSSRVSMPGTACSSSTSLIFRASALEQLVRAAIHAVFFGLAYILMLLAMYYNGYIIISIILGSGLGKFLCDWLVYTANLSAGSSSSGGGKASDVPTVCCG